MEERDEDTSGFTAYHGRSVRPCNAGTRTKRGLQYFLSPVSSLTLIMKASGPFKELIQSSGETPDCQGKQYADGDFPFGVVAGVVRYNSVEAEEVVEVFADMQFPGGGAGRGSLPAGAGGRGSKGNGRGTPPFAAPPRSKAILKQFEAYTRKSIWESTPQK
jgi:hypothetical protein